MQLSGATLVDLPLCCLYLHLNLEKEGKRTRGKKAGPESGHPGATAGPNPTVWLQSYFTTSAFLATTKLISNAKDKVCFAPFHTHFPVD